MIWVKGEKKREKGGNGGREGMGRGVEGWGMGEGGGE